MRRLVPAVSLAAMLTVAAFAPASAGAVASSPSAVPAPPPVPPMTPAETHAGRVAEHVERMPAFGGLRITPDQAAIEVYVTADDAALRAAALAAAGGARVTFTRVRHPYAKLRALQERVYRDRAAILAQGIDVVFLGVREERNRLAIGVPDYTREKADWLRRRYPGDVVEPTPAQYAQNYSSRWHDYSPWNGGDFAMGFDAFGAERSSCTTGPAAKDSSGQEYIIMAGHCFVAPGQDFDVYAIPVYQGLHGQWGKIGDARAEFPPEGGTGYDVARIKVVGGNTASGLIWRTDPPSTTCCSAPQKGTIRGTVGLGLCVSGAYSGERCAAHVRYHDVDYVPYGLGGMRILHTNVLDRDDKSESIAGKGDSGAPVYSVGPNNGLLVSGYALGGPKPFEDPLIDFKPCPDYSDDPNFQARTPYGSCSNRVYFAGINSILAVTGLTLVTL